LALHFALFIEGHFILRSSVEQTRDSSNLIGGEQKFVSLAFTLEANDQWTKASKMPTWQHFLSFGTKILSSGRKLVRNIYGNPNSPQADKHFFLNLFKVYNLYICNGFLPCLLEESLSKVLKAIR
jgi:hypothetical protein